MGAPTSYGLPNATGNGISKESEPKMSAEERYAADWWSLEMAVAWIATGNKQIAAKAASLAEERRRALKQPRFATWMMCWEGLSGLYDTVDRSLYRAEARRGRNHPIEWAIKQTTRLMVGKLATGR